MPTLCREFLGKLLELLIPMKLGSLLNPSLTTLSILISPYLSFNSYSSHAFVKLAEVLSVTKYVLCSFIQALIHQLTSLS